MCTVVERLPSMREALGSVLISAKRKEGGREGKEGGERGKEKKKHAVGTAMGIGHLSSLQGTSLHGPQPQRGLVPTRNPAGAHAGISSSQ
jgi:hypothetical protein